jgi:hypothetical protein
LAAKRRIISKRYFEKYFVEEYAAYLDENGMITIKWWAADYDDEAEADAEAEADYDDGDATLS